MQQYGLDIHYMEAYFNASQELNEDVGNGRHPEALKCGTYGFFAMQRPHPERRLAPVRARALRTSKSLSVNFIM
jgi:hypothetical protein